MKNFINLIIVMTLLFSVPSNILAQKKKDKDDKGDTISSSMVSSLKFRNIGPAFASGRVADFAVNPYNHSEYYVGFAAGGIWKTTNNGTTYKPIFDNYNSYSIGCLKMDPNNNNVIWAGTGENNHQRSVSYGDGVYKSVDGGQSWKNMGLKESRQIGMIAIDHCNSNIIYVAAEGSVWGPGEERGLYKSIDGGENWEKILEVSENTGINNVVLDPEDSNVIYATSEQRRRHVHIRIGGGPESNIWKSTDGGKNWIKLTSGIPGSDKGGIGIAVSPVDHNIIYAIIEAAENNGGFYRSEDRGESWEKMNDYNTSGQYYGEIFCDPTDVDIVYSTETVSKVTYDGGKTWSRIGNNKRHVDDHAFWIDPNDTDHFMIGGDGGIYETFNDGKDYIHKTNLPVTQFYKVGVDNTEPFYFVYGGTQDNSSIGSPSQTTYHDGITRGECVVTLGGDGFWQAVDPKNPDIVYSEYQYGNIYRFDKKSGEKINIKPQPRKGEDTYKWNWNSPFIISPHNNERIYMAANKIFRSNDRGQSWDVISDDITRQLPRDTWPVMDRYWGVDAVSKNVSTSLFGMAVSIAESKVKENLLFVGTDDGLIQITKDGGENWIKVESFEGVPEFTYVSDIVCSGFDENIVFAAFDNRKRDDFTPYIYKSTDQGETWENISSNLPENGSIHAIAQDHINPELLFVGTEFGVFFTVDGGKIWTQLKSGIPTISVKDIAIQERENDLVLATFGRGFYILDDYSPLRTLNADLIEEDAHIFPIKDALMYMKMSRGGYGFGSMLYFAKNPDFGATFTYYIKEVPKTLKKERKEKEKELIEEKQPIPIPTNEELRAEKNELAPYLIFQILDDKGNEIRKLTKAMTEGMSRINWNLRYPNARPINVDEYDPLSMGGDGMMVLPGQYKLVLTQVFRGEEKILFDTISFSIKQLNNTTLPAEDREELVAFQNKLSDLSRTVLGTRNYLNELVSRTKSIKQAAQRVPGSNIDLINRIEKVESNLDDIAWKFNGERPNASYEEIQPAPMSINHRLNSILYVHYQSTSAITQSQQDGYQILVDEIPLIIESLQSIYENQIVSFEKELDELNAPWTPGRIPELKVE